MHFSGMAQATNYVDLNPTGFTSSEARGVADNGTIAGFGVGPVTSDLSRALSFGAGLPKARSTCTLP